MTKRQDYGVRSEKMAASFLRKLKHRIITMNYRTRQGEVDIISLAPDQTLVFTEVRSRHDCRYGHPVETVNTNKKQRVRKAARQYLYEHPCYQNHACRFDVITIIGEEKDAVLEHFPDAF